MNGNLKFLLFKNKSQTPDSEIQQLKDALEECKLENKRLKLTVKSLKDKLIELQLKQIEKIDS